MWTNLIVMVALLTIPVLAAHIMARGGPPWPHAATLGAALCFLFTASGHFLLDEQMADMLPPWTPYRLELVWATGMVEIAVALGLAPPRTRRAAAWVAIAVLCLFFPANIYAASVAAPVGGHALGPAYLLIRGPVQLFLILWIYATLIRRSNSGQPRPR